MFIYVPNTFRHTQEPSGTIGDGHGPARGAPGGWTKKSNMFVLFKKHKPIWYTNDKHCKSNNKYYKGVNGCPNQAKNI